MVSMVLPLIPFHGMVLVKTYRKTNPALQHPEKGEETVYICRCIGQAMISKWSYAAAILWRVPSKRSLMLVPKGSSKNRFTSRHWLKN